MSRVASICGTLAVAFAVTGCGADGDGSATAGTTGYDADNLGSISLELATIPTGVGCVRIVATGTTTVSKDFTLAAGAPTATLNMDRLPLGNVSVSGSAFATTCGTGNAIYLADPASATLKTGVVSTLALTFRKNNQVSASVNFVGNITAIAAGASDSAVVVDGQVYAWGLNNSSNVPTLVPGLSGITDVAIASYTATLCALKNDGTIWCWGDNSQFQAGVSSTRLKITTPTVLNAGETGYTALFAGGYHFCASKGQEQVTKCWGYNASGQLANGGTTTSATPTKALLLYGFAASGSGGAAHSCFVGSLDLKVGCAGSNNFGQLGDGTTTADPYPDSIPLNATKISSGGYHSCAITSGGAVQCWGYNGNGQLGNDSTLSSSLPVTAKQVYAVAIGSGYAHNCALTDTGSVRCWGAANYGQVGDGWSGNRTLANQVLLPEPAVLLAVGNSHNCAVTASQRLMCWGDNYNGQLGDGSFVTSFKPVDARLP